MTLGGGAARYWFSEGMYSGWFQAIGTEAERIHERGRAGFGKGKQEEIGMIGFPITMTHRRIGSPCEPRAALRFGRYSPRAAFQPSPARPTSKMAALPSRIWTRQEPLRPRQNGPEVPRMPVLLARPWSAGGVDPRQIEPLRGLDGVGDNGGNERFLCSTVRTAARPTFPNAGRGSSEPGELHPSTSERSGAPSKRSSDLLAECGTRLALCWG